MSVNLLPWRDWERRRRNRIFYGELGAVVAAAMLLALGAAWNAGADIDVQRTRSAVVADAIEALDIDDALAAELRIEADRLEARTRAIEDMNAARFDGVRTFAALARTMPERVRYESVLAREGAFKATGVAESSEGVSALMRNLDASDWFGEVALRTIEENRTRGSVAFVIEFTGNPRRAGGDAGT